MERVDLGAGLSLSRLAYGMWRLGGPEDRTAERVAGRIEACLEQGITTLDQADIYGDYESEILLGEALALRPGLRERVEIVTKCGIMLTSEKFPDRRIKHYDTGARHLRLAVDNSLKKMGIERIDLLLLHRPDPLMDAHETGGALDDLVAFGKVRAVGVSNFRPQDVKLLQAAMTAPLVCNQIEASLAALEPFENGDLAFLQERKMVPMIWSPLAGGALFASSRPRLREVLQRIAAEQGVEPAAVAVAWLLRPPARLVPVMGTTDPGRIARLSEAVRVRLDREEWFELYEAARGHEVA